MVELLLRPLLVFPVLESALVAPAHTVWVVSELLAVCLVRSILFSAAAGSRRLLDGDEFVHRYYVHSLISRQERLWWFKQS